jgi:ATP-binding cassette, subfamily C (CFTR/MRP), member 1
LQALARAIYSRKELLLLDDVFSALDHDTEQKITERLFSANGLLSRTNTSTILVTHGLSHASLADRLILIDPEAKNAKMHTFEEFSKLHIMALKPSNSNGAAGSGKTTPKDEIGGTRKADNAVKTASQEDAEDLARRTGDTAVYRYYYNAIGLVRTLGACSILAIFTFTSNFPRYWIQWYTDDPIPRFAVFIGVYVMLVVVASLSQGAMIW